MVDPLNTNKEDLKCVQCKRYLSHPPIMLVPDGSVCGRCPVPEPAIRNLLYEQAVSKMEFPCENPGCMETHVIAETIKHLKCCLFTKITCPTSSCSWSGQLKELQVHYSRIHPRLVLSHPCSTKLQLSGNETLLTATLGFSFMIRVGYSEETAMLNHSVRLINGARFTRFFKYDLRIGVNELEMDSGLMSVDTLDSEIRNELNINNILHQSDGCKVTFNIRLHFKEITCSFCKELIRWRGFDFSDTHIWCIRCKQNISQMISKISVFKKLDNNTQHILYDCLNQHSQQQCVDLSTAIRKASLMIDFEFVAKTYSKFLIMKAFGVKFIIVLSIVEGYLNLRIITNLIPIDGEFHCGFVLRNRETDNCVLGNEIKLFVTSCGKFRMFNWVTAINFEEVRVKNFQIHLHYLQINVEKI